MGTSEREGCGALGSRRTTSCVVPCGSLMGKKESALETFLCGMSVCVVDECARTSQRAERLRRRRLCRRVRC